MREMINACKILVGKPERGRLLGRPRRGWEDSIVAYRLKAVISESKRTSIARKPLREA
jgi:hypothetical protein